MAEYVLILGQEMDFRNNECTQIIHEKVFYIPSETPRNILIGIETNLRIYPTRLWDPFGQNTRGSATRPT